MAVIDKSNNQKMTAMQTYMSIVKGCIGPGCLSLPFAFAKLGPYVAPFLLFGISCLAVRNFWVIVKCKRKLEHLYGCETYGELSYHASGKVLENMTNIMLVMVQLCICTVYFSFISDNIHALLESSSSSSSSEHEGSGSGSGSETGHTGGGGMIMNQRMIILFLIFPCCLMCLIKNLKSLSPFMLTGIITLSIAIIIVFITCIEESKKMSFEKYNTFSMNSLPQSFGIFVYSFEGIGLMLPIEQVVANKEKFFIVFCAGMTTVVVVFIVFAEICVLSFRQIDDGSITAYIAEIRPGTMESFFVNILASIAVLVTFPIQFYPAIQVLEVIAGYKVKLPKQERQEINAEMQDLEEHMHSSLGIMMGKEGSGGGGGGGGAHVYAALNKNRHLHKLKPEDLSIDPESPIIMVQEAEDIAFVVSNPDDDIDDDIDDDDEINFITEGKSKDGKKKKSKGGGGGHSRSQSLDGSYNFNNINSNDIIDINISNSNNNNNINDNNNNNNNNNKKKKGELSPRLLSPRLLSPTFELLGDNTSSTGNKKEKVTTSLLNQMKKNLRSYETRSINNFSPRLEDVLNGGDSINNSNNSNSGMIRNRKSFSINGSIDGSDDYDEEDQYVKRLYINSPHHSGRISRNNSSYHSHHHSHGRQYSFLSGDNERREMDSKRTGFELSNYLDQNTFRALLVCSTAGIALAVPNVAILVSLVGSSAGAYLALIMPPYLDYKINQCNNTNTTTCSKTVNGICFVLGCIGAILGITFAISDVIHLYA